MDVAIRRKQRLPYTPELDVAIRRKQRLPYTPEMDVYSWL